MQSNFSKLLVKEEELNMYSSKDYHFVEKWGRGRSLHYILCEANNSKKEDKND